MKGAVLLPLILYADGTWLSKNGSHNIKPLAMTIGNFPRAVLNQDKAKKVMFYDIHMMFTSWFIIIFHFSGYLLHAGAHCAEVPPPKEAHQRFQARIVSPDAVRRPTPSPASSEAGGLLGDVEGQVFFILLQGLLKFTHIVLQFTSPVAADERCLCPWFLHLSMTTRKGN